MGGGVLEMLVVFLGREGGGVKEEGETEGEISRDGPTPQ